MANNYYDLQMGGVDQKLKFTIGSLKRMKDILNEDPLKTLTEGIPQEKMVDYAQAIVKASCGTDQGFDDLPITELTEIVKAFGKAFTLDEPVAGESNRDTQTLKAVNA